MRECLAFQNTIDSRISNVKFFWRRHGPTQIGAERRPEAAADTADVPARARLVPTQQRSRERFERILACASEVMIEKGCDAFRMSDIVERTGISFGSLYQYFLTRRP